MWLFIGVVVSALGAVAGITAAKLIDKAAGTISTVGGLFPAGTLDPVPNVPDPANPGKTKTPWGKILTIAIISAIGVHVVRWIGRKLNIKLFKTRI